MEVCSICENPWPCGNFEHLHAPTTPVMHVSPKNMRWIADVLGREGLDQYTDEELKEELERRKNER